MLNLLDVEKPRKEEEKVCDYCKRAQWVRAAVLGANDGLLSTASLMMGVGAVREDNKLMALTGVAGLVAVYSQLDIELAHFIRSQEEKVATKLLPNPMQAALASGLSFAVGAAFIENYRVSEGGCCESCVVGTSLGGLGAVLGKAPMLIRSSLMVLIGGWLAMVVTFGSTKLVNHFHI